jgi:hypothetical protein
LHRVYILIGPFALFFAYTSLLHLHAAYKEQRTLENLIPTCDSTLIDLQYGSR